MDFEETELEKKQRGTDHDPARDVRKVVYDCFDRRIVNDNDPNVPLYMVINQHGFLGYIEERASDKFVGHINEATLFAFDEQSPGVVITKTFEECFVDLTNFHVKLFHNQYKKVRSENSKH